MCGATVPQTGSPLVFKDFNAARYVTMYNEDGYQSFIRGPNGGFEEPPTDYCIHPLLVAIDPIRKKHSSKLSTWGRLKSWSPALHGACASDEGVPQLPIHTSIRRKF